jgi:hypothetical protein
MSRFSTILSCFFGIVCLGCTSKSDTNGDADTANSDSASSVEIEAGNGRIALRFAINDDLAASMDVAPAGMFLGEIYDAEDVSAIGPADGATPLAALNISMVLSVDGTPSAILHTSEVLASEEVTVLGTLDVDESGGASGGDPVTLPSVNTFNVFRDLTEEVVVEFTLGYPGS